jgi:hypothetical protein
MVRQWWDRLQAWYVERQRPRYPVVSVDWGLVADEQKPQERLRDCGHWASSFAYDPIQERDMCLVCYRAAGAKSRRRGG